MAAILTALVLLISPVEAPPLADFPIVEPATATQEAERIDPPPPLPVDEVTAPVALPPVGSSASAGGRCVGWEGLLSEYSPGWSVERMSRIMYRESRCQPGADNPRSTATGLLQLLSSHCRWLAGQMGESCSAGRLTDPTFNVRAAATLWREQGYRAWAL